MSRAAASTAVITLYAIAALLLTERNACAQSGSTGGTVGKREKSISGTEPGDERSTPQRKNSAGAGCKLGSTWSNVTSDGGGSIWTISSDGTAVERGLGNARGRAVLSGHRLI